MDFEINQKTQPDLTTTGAKTLNRTAGDMLQRHLGHPEPVGSRRERLHAGLLRGFDAVRLHAERPRQQHRR
jgi:hypothetical protein